MLPHGGNLFRSFFFVVVIAISMLMMTVETRYLRPSDHGIDYQNNPTEVESPEMTTFFGGASAELPEAKNSTETETETEPRWESIKAPATFTRRDDNGGKDGVRKTLLIASLGCGAIGVSLMVSAVFIYLFQRRRSSSTSPSPPPPPQPASRNPCKEIVVHESS